MPESKGEGGSKVYGIILLIAGIFIVVTGIMNLLGWNPLLAVLPPGTEFLAGASGWTDMALGVWALIGGVGLLRSQEWGWGISLVVLSTVIVKYLYEVISGFLASAFLTLDFNFWIKFVMIFIAAVGIVYLLLTKYKYA